MTELPESSLTGAGKRLALVTLLAGILVALLGFFAPPASAAQLLRPETHVPRPSPSRTGNSSALTTPFSQFRVEREPRTTTKTRPVRLLPQRGEPGHQSPTSWNPGET